MTRYSERWSNRTDRLNNIIQRESSILTTLIFLFFFIENDFVRISTNIFDTGLHINGIKEGLHICFTICCWQSRYIIHQRFIIHYYPRGIDKWIRSQADRSPRINLSLVTRSPAEILLVYLDLDTMDTSLAYLILRTLRTQRKYERWIRLQQWRNMFL